MAHLNRFEYFNAAPSDRRRRKAIAAAQKKGTPPKVMGSLDAALGAVGAWLSPEYDTARERARRTPSRYRLRWKFRERNDAGVPAPAPLPGHPSRTPWGGRGLEE